MDAGLQKQVRRLQAPQTSGATVTAISTADSCSMSEWHSQAD